MKILLLHPNEDLARQLREALQQKGIGVLSARDCIEADAILQLHAHSLDLAIVHAESASGNVARSGLRWIEKVKSTNEFSSLPYILTTDEWNDEQCALHQETALGANAYLKKLKDGIKLVELVEMVVGTLPDLPIAEVPKLNVVNEVAGVPVELEDASALFDQSEASKELNQFKLKAPDFDEVHTPPPLPPVLSEEVVGIEAIEVSTDGAVSELDLTPPPPPPPSVLMRTSEFVLPVGDVVVPGGAQQSPDIETLKHYLSLREMDVAVLSRQVRDLRAQTTGLEKILQQEREQRSEMDHQVDEFKRLMDEFEREKALLISANDERMKELDFQIKAKNDKVKLLERQVMDAAREVENIKERVRKDIQKIRVREKELENRLEIARKDSEALLQARETRIIELKRKLDMTEFNMDLLQDKYMREQDKNRELSQSLERAAQAMRVAGGLLDEIEGKAS